tara:strand:+ start:3183 stop:4571 length:1389 start_codon:yes stop_codon:yes gene_type:complete
LPNLALNVDKLNNISNLQLDNKYYIETYGCQMNVYDSELIAGILEKCGYKKTKVIDKADIIFLNTCAIREKAEETVHNRLNNLAYLKRKNPKMILGVLGCMAQNLKNELLESKPYVDVILGPDTYRKIPEIINQRFNYNKQQFDTKLSKFEVYDGLFPSRHEGVNAWISISRGCDKFCTFCIVPFTRGRERSRPMQSIAQEVKNAVSNGYVEITLLGQNVNSYRTKEGTFANLIELVSSIKDVKRIRYTSPHPQDMDEELLKTMRDNKNICNYIHLPLQAGSNRILKRMNRTYNRSEYLHLVDKIRHYLPDCSISTDIIVGFPGETKSEFEETLEIMKLVKFNQSYMFKYSSRPGTKAAEYTDQIDEEIKQSRLEKVIQLQKQLTLQENQKYIGQVLDVLVEKESKKSSEQWAGRTEGNTWVVFDKTNENVKDIVSVLIQDAQGVSLLGKRIKLKESIYEVN